MPPPPNMPKTSKKLAQRVKELTPTQRENAVAKADEVFKKQWATVPEDFIPYIYLAQCGSYTKIGISINPKNRLAQLSTSNPSEVMLIFTVKHPQALMMEGVLHELYEDKKRLGEWFSLEPKDIEDVKTLINRSLEFYGQDSN